MVCLPGMNRADDVRDYEMAMVVMITVKGELLVAAEVGGAA